MLEEEVYKKIMNQVIINKEQGYALYFKYNDILIEKTNGLEREDDRFHITFNTCFRLASVSKQFIAYAILFLIEEQLLSFSTPITEIFDDLPQYFKKITIQQLLNHTSGIYDYEKMPHQENDEQIKDKQVLEFLKTTTHTYFKPGTKYQYSNTGYILLGQIIEQISKTKIDEYLKEKIFTKAKLFNTYVNDEGKDRLLGEEVAMGIIYSGDAVTLMDENPNLDYAIPKEGSNKWVDAMCIPKTAQNKKEAELFINFLLDPENAKINAEYIGYSIPNEGALKLLDKEITENPVAYPSQEVLNKCETFIDLGDKIKLYDRAWIELKSE